MKAGFDVSADGLGISRGETFDERYASFVNLSLRMIVALPQSLGLGYPQLDDY